MSLSLRQIKAWEANTRYNDNMKILKDHIKDVISADEAMLKDLRKNGFK